MVVSADLTSRPTRSPRKNLLPVRSFFLVFILVFGVLVLQWQTRMSTAFASFSTTAALYTDDDPGLQYAIFYHAYISPENIYHSLWIVHEQLSQWQASRHANDNSYYTHLGDATLPFPCPRYGRCELLHQDVTGWERYTLAKIFEYCHEHSDHNIIYLHSKGSFHPREENNHLRKVLTLSALSDQCHQGLSNTQCNVCSAHFAPIPHWHTPGNMWTAKCSHVKKLYPTRDFEGRVREIVQQLHQIDPEWREDPPDWCVGTNRYVDEHWVHTHPEVC